MNDDIKYRIVETGPKNSRQFLVQYEQDGDWKWALASPDFSTLEKAKEWLDDKTTVRPPDIIHSYP